VVTAFDFGFWIFDFGLAWGSHPDKSFHEPTLHPPRHGRSDRAPTNDYMNGHGDRTPTAYHMN
jgi:hypothetical protein